MKAFDVKKVWLIVQQLQSLTTVTAEHMIIFPHLPLLWNPKYQTGVGHFRHINRY